MKLHTIILAGGSGTRLWPESNKERPKQFLKILTEPYSLLQKTALRCAAAAGEGGGLLRVAAGAKWKALIEEQLSAIGIEGECVYTEPCGRNTAPAIALGAAFLLLDGASPSDAMLVAPSDHIIEDGLQFRTAIEAALGAASEGKLVTFGVLPANPETGFGYIKVKKSAGLESQKCFEVEAFVEKPDIERAKKYLESGDYFWNAGIFCWRIQDIIAAFNEHFKECSPIFAAAQKAAAGGAASDSTANAAVADSTANAAAREAVRTAFLSSPSISIDYAVLEKTKNIACVLLDSKWSDIGSWDAVYENSGKDGEDNAVFGRALLENCRGNLIRSSSGRLVAAINIQDLMIIDTGEAILVAPRSSSQELRSLVERLT